MAWSMNIIYYSRSEPKDHIICEIYHWKIFLSLINQTCGQQEVTGHLWCSQPHTFSDSSPGYCSTLPAIYTILAMCVCMGRVELKVQPPYLLLSLFQRINESKEKESPLSRKRGGAAPQIDIIYQMSDND